MEATTGTASAGKPTAAAQEERRRFEDFTHRDAWNLAGKILEKYGRMTAGQEHPKGIGVRIVVDGARADADRKSGREVGAWLTGKCTTERRIGQSWIGIGGLNEMNHVYE